MTDAITRFDVVFEVEAKNTGKFRNEATVHKRGRGPRTDFLPSDEGPYHGGDGTAPYPLAYFASGLTTCIMTQLRAFSKRLGVPVTDIYVNTSCQWQAEQVGNAPYVGSGVGFRLDIDLQGDISLDDKKRVIEAAGKGCFVEAVLKPGLVAHRLKAGDDWIEV